DPGGALGVGAVEGRAQEREVDAAARLGGDQRGAVVDRVAVDRLVARRVGERAVRRVGTGDDAGRARALAAVVRDPHVVDGAADVGGAGAGELKVLRHAFRDGPGR